MKRKYVYRAWMAKSGLSTERNDDWLTFYLYTRKGCEHEWDAEDWPPVRVKVTVEVEKQKGRKA